MTKKKILNIKFLSAGLLLVLIGIAVWLTLSGRIVVVWKQPAGQVAIINASVCNDSVVTTYNNAALSQQRGGSSEYTIDKTALNSLVTDIKNKPDYQSDPTCQTILMLTAVTDANYEAAKTAYTVVKDLHDKHQYADSNLSTGGPLSAYQSFVDALSPSNKGVGNQGPQGGK